MKHFLIAFPESDEILALYYALQESGLPCTIVRHELDQKLIKVTPEQLPSTYPEHQIYFATIKGFIDGWVNCYYRQALPVDKSLQPNPGCIVP